MAFRAKMLFTTVADARVATPLSNCPTCVWSVKLKPSIVTPGEDTSTSPPELFTTVSGTAVRVRASTPAWAPRRVNGLSISMTDGSVNVPAHTATVSPAAAAATADAIDVKSAGPTSQTVTVAAEAGPGTTTPAITSSPVDSASPTPRRRRPPDPE